VSDVASPHFVGNTHTTCAALAKGPLFLNDDDYSITCTSSEVFRGRDTIDRTNPGSLSLFPHYRDAFDDSSPGVVDAIQHRLRRVSLELWYC
jgi:hypothetical protein